MAETKAQLEERAAALEAENAELRAGAGSSAPAAPAGPHILGALQSILGRLSVEKGGQLPANMGGKPYISAVDLNLEIKREFVREKLVIVPKEHVTHFEVLDGSRKQTFMVIEGTYQIISSVDGSNVTIGGVGDGSAIGSAVTANIASTNALKNALLRFFLVTEQSAEDAAKETPGATEGAAPQGDRAMQAAGRAGQTRSAVPQPVVSQQPEPPEKAKIRAEYIDNPESPYTREQVNGIMDAVKAQEEFRGADKLYPEIYRRLQTGELA